MTSLILFSCVKEGICHSSYGSGNEPSEKPKTKIEKMKTQIDHEVRHWDNPTPRMVRERNQEDIAFEDYRKKRDALRFMVKDAFGFSLYSTLEEAIAFALTLKGSSEIVDRKIPTNS